MNLDKVLLIGSGLLVGLGIVGAAVGTAMAPDGEAVARTPEATAVAAGPTDGADDEDGETDPAGMDGKEAGGAGAYEEDKEGDPKGDDEEGGEQPPLPALEDDRPREPLDLEATLALIKPDELKSWVTTLASDKMAGRKTGSDGAKRARSFIAEQIEFGAVSEVKDSFIHPFERDGLSGTNVIGLVPGRHETLKNEFIVVAAHYDGRGRAKKGKDSIYNGADDNASGTAAVMALGKAMAFGRLQLDRSVLIVLFAGNQQKTAGAWAFVDDPPVPLESIVAMVNLDTIGNPSGRAVKLYGVGGAEAFGDITRDLIGADDDISPIKEMGKLRKKGDNYPFYKKKVPILILHGKNGDAGKTHDHADQLDYDRLAELTRFSLRLAHALANHPEPIR